MSLPGWFQTVLDLVDTGKDLIDTYFGTGRVPSKESAEGNTEAAVYGVHQQLLDASKGLDALKTIIAHMDGAGTTDLPSIKYDTAQLFINLYALMGASEEWTLLDVKNWIEGISIPEFPTEPPEGWNIPSGDAPWGTYLPDYDPNVGPGQHAAARLLSDIDAAANGLTGLNGLVDSRQPWLILHAARGYDLAYSIWQVYPAPFVQPPTEPDWSLWDGSESLVDFLNDHSGVSTWSETAPFDRSTPGWAWGPGPQTPYSFWRCRYPQWMLPYLSGQLPAPDLSGILAAIDDAVTDVQAAITVAVGDVNDHTDGAAGAITSAIATSEENVLAAIAGIDIPGPSSSPLTPPVWPGLAHVTLGAPVALQAATTLTGSMDGVIVTLTTPPTSPYDWLLGDQHSYYKLGQLAFVTDRGDAEEWQNMQFGNQVYVPKHMSHAAGCIVRSPTQAVGTVRPWSVAS